MGWPQYYAFPAHIFLKRTIVSSDAEIWEFFLFSGEKKGYPINELVIALLLHYSVYLGMAIFGNPENEISVGLHETVGPCDEWEEQKTLFTLITGEVN